MIPRIFHRVFLDDPIPDEYEGYWQRFKALHPGWEFFTWNDSGDLGWMRCRSAFDQATTDAGRSDVLRYEVLATFGGIYVDTDVEPLKSFDGLLEGDPFIGWESPTLLCPTVMGSEPGHPAIEALIRALPAWAARRKDRPPNQQTGPHFVTRQWRTRTDVRRLSAETFYPVLWWERDRLGGPYPPESLAVHHWAQNWDLEAKARIDAAQRIAT